MKSFITIFAILCLPMALFSQDISGRWKGTIYNDSTKQSLQYEIVINKENGRYSGFSHTWFLIGEKKYYGLKKVKVHIAKDGKVIIEDAALLENNYPLLPDNRIRQLNVLEFREGAEPVLDGIFVTNRTKQFNELTGRINVRRVSSITAEDVTQYVQRTVQENNPTASK
ncbi:MAG: hypothetical protein JWQ27_333 [Ferruginibacter sp.]|nr:hypothetical protein [Ferruginibacter sp.]